MGWKEDMRPGSFRGVKFHCRNAGGPIGRRVQVNVFAMRDEATSNDLGGLAEELQFDAFVIGADYMARRDAMIKALKTAGPGELIHPWRGRFWVTALPAELNESSEDGGMAVFSLTFVEVAEGKVATVKPDYTAAAVTAANALGATAQADFGARFTVTGRPAWILDEAGAVVESAQGEFDKIASTLTGYGQPLQDFIARGNALRADVLTLAASPLKLGAEMFGLVQGLRQLARTPGDAVNMLKALTRFGAGMSSPAPSTPLRAVQAANQSAVVDLVRRAAAAEAVRATTGMSFVAYQESAGVRDALDEQLEQLALDAGDAGDDNAFRAIEAVRIAMVRDITDRAADLARITYYTPPATLPAIVVAHLLYGTVNLEARADDIIARNDIRHPGFVPAGAAIEVLSS